MCPRSTDDRRKVPVPMARPLTKTNEFTVRITEAQRERLEAWAAAAGMSMTDFLIYAAGLDTETTSSVVFEWPEEVAERLGIPVAFDTDKLRYAPAIAPE